METTHVVSFQEGIRNGFSEYWVDQWSRFSFPSLTLLRQSNPFDLTLLVCWPIKLTFEETPLWAKTVKGMWPLISRRESVHAFADTALKWITFTPELTSGWSVLRSSFWRRFHFQSIQLCFGSCSGENKMQIFFMLKENSHSPQLKVATVNENILIFVYEKSLSNTRTLAFSFWEFSYELHYERGKKTLDRSYMICVRKGMCGVSLPSPCSFLPPLTLDSVKLNPVLDIQIFCEYGKDIVETRQHICIFLYP